MAEQLLFVDDDREFCALMRDYLGGEGFDVRCAHDGVAALAAQRSRPADIIVLDVMMPLRNGLDVLRELRQFSQVPVLMLTARGEDLDRIVGLEVGADDYVPKPCNPRELVARLRAILRRTQAVPDAERAAGSTLHIADIELRPSEHRVLCAGQDVGLTSAEYATLEVLLRHAGRVVRKSELMQAAFGRRLGPYDRGLDMHISRLRRKLGLDPQGMERIKTVRGVGYLYVRDQGAPA
jgi:DNA-binding response OmpR family regulator